MLARYVKTSCEKILLPVSKRIPDILTPNLITAIGFLISLTAGVFFGLGKIRLAGFLLLVAGFFDLLDGAYSRLSGLSTKFGAVRDSILDRYSDLCIMGGIIFYFAESYQLIYVFLSTITLVGFIMISYTKARAENIIRSCNVGLMERPERILVLSAGSLINRLKPTVWILAVLCNQTAIQRIWFTYKEIGSERTREVKEHEQRRERI